MKAAFAVAITAVLVVLTHPPRLDAKETLVALGHVDYAGKVTRHSSPVGAEISSKRMAAGIYHLSMTLPASFENADREGFLVSVSMKSSVSVPDLIASAVVEDWSERRLLVQVDLAAGRFLDGDRDNPLPGNGDFYFSIRYLDPKSGEFSPDSRHLLAIGTMVGVDPYNPTAEAGRDISSLNGISVSAVRTGAGEYRVVLTKPGAFAGDSLGDYLVFLNWTNPFPIMPSISSSEQPINGDFCGIYLRGEAVETGSDDSVVIRINMQGLTEFYSSSYSNLFDGADSQLDGVGIFRFMIFSLTSADRTGPPASRKFVAHASVDASGKLIAGSSRFTNGPVTSRRIRNGSTFYEIDFGDPSPFWCIPFVTVNAPGRSRTCDARMAYSSDGQRRLVVVVRITDCRRDSNGTSILEVSESFSVSLAYAEEPFNIDLSVSRVGLGGPWRGDGHLSPSGAQQSVRLRRLLTTWKSVYFRARNIAGMSRDVVLSAQIPSARVDARFFAATPDRRNVTAQFLTARGVGSDLRPDQMMTFEARYRFRHWSPRDSEVTTHLRDSRYAELIPGEWGRETVTTFLNPR
jgi:hypothetical protein